MDSQGVLSGACADVMPAAFVDKNIMPPIWKRNSLRQARLTFSVFVTERAESEMVQDYTNFACHATILRDGVVARPKQYLQGKKLLELLENVQVGHMRHGRIDGVKGQDDTALHAKIRINGVMHGAV